MRYVGDCWPAAGRKAYVVFHRPLTLRLSRLSCLLCSMVLIGCPQLLQDDFANLPTPANGGSSGSGGATALSVGGAGAGAGGLVATGGNAGRDATGGDPVSSGAGGSGNAGVSGSPNDAGSPTDAEPGPGAVLAAALLHRYRFDTAGSSIADSVGSANGTAFGASVVAGSGKITLSGSDQFVDMPNGIISGLQSVTLEAWVNWADAPNASTDPGADWQTVFSFGADENAYVFLTAKSGDTGDVLSGYTLTGFNAERRTDGEAPLPPPSDPQRGTHVAVVVDAAQGTLSMYVEGVLAASPPATPPPGQDFDLSAINDINNWLGRSQFASDPEFAGDFLEFRIYGVALDAATIALSFELGPDTEL